MGIINIENAIVQLQGDIIVQNQKIEQLREEIRLLRLEIQKKPVKIFQYSKEYRSKSDPGRAADVYRQFKASKK